MKKIYLLFSLVFIFAILIIIYLSNHWIRISETKVRLENLQTNFKGYRIVHLCDLHAVQFGDKQEKLLNNVKCCNPDIIVFTGDLVDSNKNDPEEVLPLMQNLNDIAPVYFVNGNHEYYYKDYNILIEGLKKIGVLVLDNRSIILRKNKSEITLAGVNDPFTGHDDIDKALANVDRYNPLILLAHAPEIFDLASQKGVNLVLSGHYHGGQIRLPFAGAVYAPGRKFFPEYDSGLYEKNGSYMYLSRGLGYTGIFPFRFLNRPEVAVIILS